MADWYGAEENQDFTEEEVWSVLKDKKEGSSRSSSSLSKQMKNKGKESSSAWRLPSAKRVLSKFNSDQEEGQQQQGKTAAAAKAEGKAAAGACGRGSAPMAIPDWSRIYSKRSTKRGPMKGGLSSAFANDDGDNRGDDHHGHEVLDGIKMSGDDENDDDGSGASEDDETLPPHEYIAKRMARTRIASHSMCEGIGGTLKGRDLTKVRNAILTKTGFLE